jgi:phage terminase small subunit
MTPRERRFVDEYLVDADPTKAARRAGYRADSAKQTGAKLLKRAPVCFAIQERQAERNVRLGLSRERVLREYARIAFANLARIASWDADGFALAKVEDIEDDDAAAISGIVIGAGDKGAVLRVRFHDKGFAIEALAQYLGLYDDAPPQEAQRSARDELMALLEAVMRREGE